MDADYDKLPVPSRDDDDGCFEDHLQSGGSEAVLFRTRSRVGSGLLGLLKGPLSRFGDTASNSGSLHLLNSLDSTKNLPVWLKSLCASVCAGSFRIFLMPVDTLKTILQVEGKNGIPILKQKLKRGPQVLYYGAIATASATFVGHYPVIIQQFKVVLHLQLIANFDSETRREIENSL